MHSAGIYADMTVDGPEIGTLVLIVDRAKNLPNRKSIGKQNPYCAARLGKEARKTETDRRGGQTPRWDQELRFTVHDSPDYYQLKVSLFNDDKKTEMIGETWIDLKAIILPGGGQNDIWHNLACKGKYAGEVRIEITYYDSRPKQDKDVTTHESRQTSTTTNDGPSAGLSGPRQQKSPVKRRPLPNDPTPSSPSPTPTSEHAHLSQRALHGSSNSIPRQSPLQAVEYGNDFGEHRQDFNGQYRQVDSSQPSYHADVRGEASHQGMPAHYNPSRESGQRHEAYRVLNNDPFTSDPSLDVMIETAAREPLSPYSNQQPQYARHTQSRDSAPTSPGGAPPPPPAHRSHHNTPVASSPAAHTTYTESPHHARFTELRQEHRHSMPNIHDSTYQGQSPPKHYGPQASQLYTPPRHNSHDSMQLRHKPSPPLQPMDHSPRPEAPIYDDRRYDQSASPAPLVLHARGGDDGLRSMHAHPHRSSLDVRPQTGSPTSYQDRPGSQLSSMSPYAQQSQSSLISPNSSSSRRSQEESMTLTQSGYRPRDVARPSSHFSDEPMSSAGQFPILPETLVACMDPEIAAEVSRGIYAEQRRPRRDDVQASSRSYGQAGGTQAPYSQTMPHSQARREYERPVSRGFDSSSSHTRPQSHSPHPDTIPRKSVSPAPFVTLPEPRRLSAIPFGPDDYSALNPNVSPAQATAPDMDTHAKIIMHDGREVDPSDHLPEHSWAPEPEARSTPKNKSKSSSNTPTHSGARPLPTPVSAATSRRQLKFAIGRAVEGSHSSPVFMSDAMSDPDSPSPFGSRPEAFTRRLQKRSTRSGMGTEASSPLAPVDNYNDNAYAHRSLPPRSQTLDFERENYLYGGQNSGAGRTGSSGPPVPAKVPYESPRAVYHNEYDESPGRNGSGGSARRAASDQDYYEAPSAVTPYQRAAGGGPPEENAWALLEEMKSIDLGGSGGRARRSGWSGRG